jgi:hypothetical protein
MTGSISEHAEDSPEIDVFSAGSLTIIAAAR